MKKTIAGKTIACMSVVIMLSAAVYATELSSTARSEIAHLLDYLSASGCEFYRNGSWHTAGEARAHIERKYRYLLNIQAIGSAEDFIAKAATQSSMSGEAYRVRCGGNGAISPSAVWLRAELTRLRQKPAQSP